MTEEEINQAVERHLEEKHLELRVICLEALITELCHVDYAKMLEKAKDELRVTSKEAIIAELKRLKEEENA